MIEIRGGQRDIEDQGTDSGHVIVADVLRLVSGLMIIGVAACREERYWYSPLRIRPVVTPAIQLLLVAARVQAIIQRKTMLRSPIHLLDNVAELGGKPARSDDLQVSRAAT